MNCVIVWIIGGAPVIETSRAGLDMDNRVWEMSLGCVIWNNLDVGWIIWTLIL